MLAIGKKAMISAKRKKGGGGGKRKVKKTTTTTTKPICEFLEIPSLDKNRHSICGKHEGQRSICQFASCAR
jgi:hypothetical protein